MKRLFLILSIATLVLCLTLCAACAQIPSNDKSGEDQTIDYSNKKIVFLGDSIAEGIIGVSPEEERVNNAYYGILGQINGFEYENRAISGQQSGEMLQFISTEESDANMPISHIKTADIICISITGNDLLWHNFPCMLYEIVAKELLGENFVNDERVKSCYLYNKYSTIDDINGELYTLKPGDGLKTFEMVKTRAKRNITAILAKLREYNPNAKIFLQNTYDPVDDESEIIAVDLVEALTALDDSYNFQTEESVAIYRALGYDILGSMSTILSSFASDEKNIYFVDVAKRFDEVYKADQEKGKALIFVDGVHPSNQGHAMIARIYQERFIEMGLAEGVKSLEKYKNIRISQFERMYKDEYVQKGGSAEKFISGVKSATSMEKVDDFYFKEIENLTAKTHSSPIENMVTNGVRVKETETYLLYDVELSKAGAEIQEAISGMLPTIAEKYMPEKSLTLNTDGTMEIRLSIDLTSPLISSLINSVLGSIDGSVVGAIEDQVYKDENGNITGLKLAGAQDAYQALKAYAEELFPGVGFGEGTFGQNFSMLYNSLGINIEGLESFTSEKYVDNVGLFLDMGENGEIDQTTIGKEYASYVDYLLAYLSRYTLVVDDDGRQLHVNKLPDNLSEKISGLTKLTIVILAPYSLVTLKSTDNVTYDAVYTGRYYEKTSPFLILTRDLDEDGLGTISFANQMIGLKVTFDNYSVE
ncbi:MAG: hypothetical protein IJS93_02475 [Clostridia bacterium]|nr:hypothetical protein [Clostridia bacterium]